MSISESRRVLRRLELEAYACVVTALRAQGQLTLEKKSVLTQLSQQLSISTDRHHAEVRRAICDDDLCYIADCVSGTQSRDSWLPEARRLGRGNPKLVARHSLSASAQAQALTALSLSGIRGGATGGVGGVRTDHVEGSIEKKLPPQVQSAIKIVLANHPNAPGGGATTMKSKVQSSSATSTPSPAAPPLPSPAPPLLSSAIPAPVTVTTVGCQTEVYPTQPSSSSVGTQVDIEKKLICEESSLEEKTSETAKELKKEEEEEERVKDEGDGTESLLEEKEESIVEEVKEVSDIIPPQSMEVMVGEEAKKEMESLPAIDREPPLNNPAVSHSPPFVPSGDPVVVLRHQDIATTEATEEEPISPSMDVGVTLPLKRSFESDDHDDTPPSKIPRDEAAEDGREEEGVVSTSMDLSEGSPHEGNDPLPSSTHEQDQLSTTTSGDMTSHVATDDIGSLSHDTTGNTISVSHDQSVTEPMETVVTSAVSTCIVEQSDKPSVDSKATMPPHETVSTTVPTTTSTLIITSVEAPVTPISQTTPPILQTTPPILQATPPVATSTDIDGQSSISTSAGAVLITRNSIVSDSIHSTVQSHPTSETTPTTTVSLPQPVATPIISTSTAINPSTNFPLCNTSTAETAVVTSSTVNRSPKPVPSSTCTPTMATPTNPAAVIEADAANSVSVVPSDDSKLSFPTLDSVVVSVSFPSPVSSKVDVIVLEKSLEQKDLLTSIPPLLPLPQAPHLPLVPPPPPPNLPLPPAVGSNSVVDQPLTSLDNSNPSDVSLGQNPSKASDVVSQPNNIASSTTVTSLEVVFPASGNLDPPKQETMFSADVKSLSFGQQQLDLVPPTIPSSLPRSLDVPPPTINKPDQSLLSTLSCPVVPSIPSIEELMAISSTVEERDKTLPLAPSLTATDSSLTVQSTSDSLPMETEQQSILAPPIPMSFAFAPPPLPSYSSNLQPKSSSLLVSSTQSPPTAGVAPPLIIPSSKTAPPTLNIPLHPPSVQTLFSFPSPLVSTSAVQDPLSKSSSLAGTPIDEGDLLATVTSELGVESIDPSLLNMTDLLSFLPSDDVALEDLELTGGEISSDMVVLQEGVGGLQTPLEIGGTVATAARSNFEDFGSGSAAVAITATPESVLEDIPLEIKDTVEAILKSQSDLEKM